MELIVLNCRGKKISVDVDTIKNYGFFKGYFSSRMHKDNEEFFLNHDVKIVHKLLNYMMGYEVNIDKIKDIARILSIDIIKNISESKLMAINSYEIKNDWNKYIDIFNNYGIDIDKYIKKYSASFDDFDIEFFCLTKQLIIQSYESHLDLIGNEDINITINESESESEPPYDGKYIVKKNYKAQSNDDYFYIYRLINEGTYNITFLDSNSNNDSFGFEIKIKYVYKKSIRDFTVYVQKEKIKRLK